MIMCEVEVLASGVKENAAELSFLCTYFMVLPFLFSFLGPRLEHEIHHIKNDTTGKGFLSQYYLF